MRHRMASYNEESGRYKQLEPVFYVPDNIRPLVQVGKTGNYTFESGSEAQYESAAESIQWTSTKAYHEYERLLKEGIAKEVARMVLPVNIYSSAYVTMNLRGLMNFLSLRTKREYAHHKSHPQREIEMVAEGMEEAFKTVTPLAYNAFCISGRVQP
jgi:thymidylate synthase (FAD)